MLILEKDLYRRRSKQNSLLAKVKLENIYQWIAFAYCKVKGNSNLITNCFNKAGICEGLHLEVVCQDMTVEIEDIPLELSNISDDTEEEEDLIYSEEEMSDMEFFESQDPELENEAKDLILAEQMMHQISDALGPRNFFHLAVRRVRKIFCGPQKS